MTIVDTVGRCSSQFSATWGTVLLRLGGHRIERVDDPEQVLLRHLRAGVEVGLVVQARNLRAGPSTAELPGQAGPPERTPDDRSDFLIERRAASVPIRSRGR